MDRDIIGLDPHLLEEVGVARAMIRGDDYATPPAWEPQRWIATLMAPLGQAAVHAGAHRDAVEEAGRFNRAALQVHAHGSEYRAKLVAVMAVCAEAIEVYDRDAAVGDNLPNTGHHPSD